MKATAEARANIALIKYWGQTDPNLNLPLTSSVSLTLDGLVTRTTVRVDPALKRDELMINEVEQGGPQLARVGRHLDRLRQRAGVDTRCRVVSTNNFAASAGLASSASAFAALTVAGLAALGAKATPREMSTIARVGSGSAARSIFGGFVEWRAAATHEESYAQPLAPVKHLDVHDVAIVFSDHEKKVGSTEGHALAATSPLNAARVARVPALLKEVREGLMEKDFPRMGRAAEEDALLMHAVMMTSRPSLLYWSGATVDGLHLVREMRDEGIEAYATIDAGPNLHLLCMREDARAVAKRAREAFPQAQVLDNGPGEGAQLVDKHLF